MGAESSGAGGGRRDLCSASEAMQGSPDLCVFLDRWPMAFIEFSSGSVTLTQFREVHCWWLHLKTDQPLDAEEDI